MLYELVQILLQAFLRFLLFTRSVFSFYFPETTKLKTKSRLASYYLLWITVEKTWYHI